MKYYDLKDKKYYNNQNETNSRKEYNEKLINGLYELAKIGVFTNVDNIEIDEFFDKDVIRKNLLYLELKHLVTNNGNQSRIEEIQQILNPPNEENVTNE